MMTRNGEILFGVCCTCKPSDIKTISFEMPKKSQYAPVRNTNVVARRSMRIYDKPSEMRGTILPGVVVKTTKSGMGHAAFRVKVGDTWVLYNPNDSQRGDVDDGFLGKAYLADYRPFQGRESQIAQRGAGQCNEIANAISRWWYSDKNTAADKWEALTEFVLHCKTADDFISSLDKNLK